jgi:signal transduction histidine kinase
MKSLKLKFAAAASLLVVMVLVVNAVDNLVSRRRELRQEITSSVVSFSRLTVSYLGDGYQNHHRTAYFRFRGLVSNLMAFNRHVESIQLVSIEGVVMFDSRSMDGRGGNVNPEVLDQQTRERVKWMELSQREIVYSPGREHLEVVVPYFDEWGRHLFSVRYLAGYHELSRLFYNTIYQVLLKSLLFIALGVILAYVAARRVTDPLTRLTMTIREVGKGRVGQMVEIGSDDEIGELASDFNQMSQQLKENLEALSESYEKLYQANLSLRELDKLKSEFMANVSHELKSPLTAIVGYTDYLMKGKMGPVTEAQLKGLEVINRNLKKLTRQIIELVDATSIEAGRMSVMAKTVAVKPMLEEVAASYRAEANSKKLKLEVCASSTLQATADRDRLIQVLDNLVENAIKFTSSGAITLCAEAAGPGRVRISVSDTGPGIPLEYIPRIFDRFYQVDGSSTRKYGGVGLGLSIVKSIIESHGSTIEVSSRLGSGTTFSFVLDGPQEGGQEKS